MKKLFKILVLTMIALIMFTSSVFAKPAALKKAEGSVTPQEVAACSLYGIHRAYPQRTWYYCYIDGVRVGNVFSMFKCACGDYVFADGYPHLGGQWDIIHSVLTMDMLARQVWLTLPGIDTTIHLRHTYPVGDFMRHR